MYEVRKNSMRKVVVFRYDFVPLKNPVLMYHVALRPTFDGIVSSAICLESEK